MLLVIGMMIFGGAFGGLRARRRKGTNADVAHYVVTHAVIFAILAVFIQIFLLRGAS